MYRVIKALNHNAVLAVGDNDNQEYILMGKGIGFGKRVSERIEAAPDTQIYSLQNVSEKGRAKELISDTPAECFEVADRLLSKAAEEFGEIDRDILFPLANHIAYAVKRMQAGELISNPLNSDIRILFYNEYKIAECARAWIKELMQVDIVDDEVGYIAFHVHSCINDEKVSVAMQMTMSVRECITLIEEHIGQKIDVLSLDYNRLMNHVKYMIARLMNGEKIKLDMNAYIRENYSQAYEIADTVCSHMSKNLGRTVDEVEIGYLAMHIERVLIRE